MKATHDNRKRQITYYLDKVHERIALHEDGTIGELEQKNIEVIRDVPTRVEGRSKEARSTVAVMAETALYASLSEYLASIADTSIPYHEYGKDYSWTLEDFPNDIVEFYESWKLSSEHVSIDDIRAAAHDLIAADEMKETMMTPCLWCLPEAKYACRASGRAREYFLYPSVDVSAEGERRLSPIDVAAIIDANPSAIRIEDEFYADSRQRLCATKTLVLDIANMPASCFGFDSQAMAEVHGSDKLNTNPTILLSKWSEDTGGEKVPTYSHRGTRDSYLSMTPPEVVLYVQKVVAGTVIEVDETQDYDGAYQKLITQLAKKGLTLFYEYTSSGMGESDAKYNIARKRDDYYGPESVLAWSIDSREGVRDATKELYRRQYVKRDTSSHTNVE